MLARTVSKDYWGDSLEWAEEEKKNGDSKFRQCQLYMGIKKSTNVLGKE